MVWLFDRVEAGRRRRPCGLACGVKPSGAPDLSMVATADRRAVSAAGVFTTNLATAAPVQVSRAHLTDGRFMRAFLDKGRLEPLLRTIPVRVVLNEKTALFGAARVAAKAASA